MISARLIPALCAALLFSLANASVAENLPLRPVGSGLGNVAFGADCSVGQVALSYSSEAGSWPRTVFRLRTPTGDWGEPEEIEGAGASDMGLFHVKHGGTYRWEMLQLSSTGVDHFVREAPGQWVRERSLFVPGSSWTQLMSVTMDEGGLWHIAVLKDSSPPMLHYYSYDGTASGWSGEEVESFERMTEMVAFDQPHNTSPPRMLSLGVDGAGVPHLVVSADQQEVSVPGGTRVSSELYYFTKVDGSWQRQTLVASGGGHDDAGLGASLVVASDGTVAVAATYLPRAQTGSPGQASLLYLTRDANGNWQQETVVSHASGYASFDGERGTGLYPYLVLDGQGSPHIVFTDHASEHTQGTAFSYTGQMRHATRDALRSGAWQVRTLVSQPTNDAFLRRLDYPVVAASSAACGSRLAFFAHRLEFVEVPEFREDRFEFFLLEGEAVTPEPRWVPGNWAYFQWPYAYDIASGAWYYFDPGGLMPRVDMGNGEWESIDQAAGWHYFMWPFVYSDARSTWLWHAPDGEQWVVNMNTAVWALLGE